MTASLTPAESARLTLAKLEAGHRVVSAVVTGGVGTPGARSVMWRGGVRGSLGHPELDDAFVRAAQTTFSPERADGAQEVQVQWSEGATTVYLELHAPPARMVIVGGGHIAQPLCQLGTMIGFAVEVLDDRDDFAKRERFPRASRVRTIDFRDPFKDTPLDPTTHVILVTRGHRFDYECLIRILKMDEPPGYIGMIGSRRRVRATHEQLVADGFSLDQIRSVRAPVGLDLGGQTPAEIAVSVTAEIVLLRSGGSGTALSEKERIVDRFFVTEEE